MRFIFLFLMCFVPSITQAAMCYSDREAEAEQAIRIHSELMVIGLNCQHRTPPDQKNYYVQYKEFTSKHGRLLANYEATLIDYFKRTGTQDGEQQMNKLRTQFANKISGDAAKMRPDLFCTQYTPRIAKAATMTDKQVRVWAGTVFPSHPVSRPLCASAKGP